MREGWFAKMMGINLIKDDLFFFLNGGLCKMMACAKQCDAGQPE